MKASERCAFSGVDTIKVVKIIDITTALRKAFDSGSVLLLARSTSCTYRSISILIVSGIRYIKSCVQCVFPRISRSICQPIALAHVEKASSGTLSGVPNRALRAPTVSSCEKNITPIRKDTESSVGQPMARNRPIKKNNFIRHRSKISEGAPAPASCRVPTPSKGSFGFYEEVDTSCEQRPLVGWVVQFKEGAKRRSTRRASPRMSRGDRIESAILGSYLKVSVDAGEPTALRACG